MERVIARLRAASQWITNYIARQGTTYWLWAIVVLAGSVVATPTVEKYLQIDEAGNWLYQRLTNFTGGRYLEPETGRVVLIRDDDYHGRLKKRTPINRSYLAEIVRALDRANADVIALDFDFSIEDYHPPGDIHGALANDYEPESEADTKDLIAALEDIATRRRIVLARMIQPNSSGMPVLMPDVLQPFGLCTGIKKDGVWDNPGISDDDAAKYGLSPQDAARFKLRGEASNNIACGFVILLNNSRGLPLSLPIDGQPGRMDSFSLAIVRFHDEVTANEYSHGSWYLSYMPDQVVDSHNVMVAASQVLKDQRYAEQIAHGRAVIVGGGFHKHAPSQNDADLTDLHKTPVHMMLGALIHDNFVEAILKGRTLRDVPNWILVTVEVLFGLGAAMLFAAYSQLWVKILAFFVLLTILLLVQWVMLGLFGTIFEAIVPLVGVAMHSIIDRLFEKKAHDGRA